MEPAELPIVPIPASSDRDQRGRFRRGWKGGKGGNPAAARMRTLQATLLAAVSDDDVRAIALGLVRAAQCGDVAAAKLVIDRTLGKPALDVEADLDAMPIALQVGNLKSPTDVVRLLHQTAQEFCAGRLGTRHAAALLGISDALRRAMETEDLAQRVATLEGMRRG